MNINIESEEPVYDLKVGQFSSYLPRYLISIYLVNSEMPKSCVDTDRSKKSEQSVFSDSSLIQ